MSQDELAERLGVSRQSISLWETGQTQPTIDNIIALAKIFNISTDELLGNSVERPLQDVPPKQKKKAPIWLFIVIGVALTAVIGGLVIFFSLYGSRFNGGGPGKTSVLVPSAQSEGGDTADISTLPDVSGGNETSVTPTPVTPTPVTPTPVTPTPVTPTPVTPTPVTPTPVTPTPVTPTPVTPTPVTPTPPKPVDLYACCKDFALKIGNVNGDLCMYQQPSERYGGYPNEYFSISYWAGYNKVEFCLHCPLSDTLSINFYLTMRGGYDHKYEYSVSKYYRDSGESMRYAQGYIDPATFTSSYPLSYDQYVGSTSGQTEFMEEARVGICDLIRCLKNFVVVEQMDCDFSDFEFKNF